MDESAEEQELRLITEKNQQYEVAFDFNLQETVDNTGNDEWIREYVEGMPSVYHGIGYYS